MQNNRDILLTDNLNLETNVSFYEIPQRAFPRLSVYTANPELTLPHHNK